MRSRRTIVAALLAALTATVLAVAATSAAAARSQLAKSASTSRHKMLLGLMDDALFLYQPDTAFAAVKALHPQIIRFDADWPLVALRRPLHARDPSDPAYDFSKVDDVVLQAAALKIPVVLSIAHTPTWAGGTKAHNRAPKRINDLQDYAYAIATRYSGKYKTPDGILLPRVSRWVAWNEPNTQAHLYPQFIHKGHSPNVACALKTPIKQCIPRSPALYVSILNAIYRGVHAAGKKAGVSETVAGGVTKPLGEGAHAHEPSIAPLKFLRLIAPRHPLFDVYAHHPYRSSKSGTPSTGDNVGFDALPKLFQTLDHYWPRKHYHLWITEYGVQTNPPDKFIGIPPSKQARILRDNVATARKNPRVDMMIWFLIRDEAVHGSYDSGFQTGLEYVNGRLKPAYSAFRSLAR